MKITLIYYTLGMLIATSESAKYQKVFKVFIEKEFPGAVNLDSSYDCRAMVNRMKFLSETHFDSFVAFINAINEYLPSPYWDSILEIAEEPKTLIESHNAFILKFI